MQLQRDVGILGGVGRRIGDATWSKSICFAPLPATSV
jgi:hypothetical protein